MNLMTRNGWERTLASHRHELNSIESRAKAVSNALENLRREAEGLKLGYLQHSLEERIKSEARQRGFNLILRDGEKMRNSLLVAAGGLIFGGLVTRHKPTALNMGLSGFDVVAQGFGKKRWYFSFDKRIVLASGDSAPSQGRWVAWESLRRTLARLKQEAQRGEDLGNLDTVIAKLEHERL